MRLLSIVLLAWGAVLALIGWGRLVEAALRRSGGQPRLPALEPGVAGCIGLALSLLAAGPFVAAGLFRVWLGIIWLAIGLAAAVLLWLRSHPPLLPTPAGRLRLAVLGLLTLYLAVHATRLVPVNLCDNESSYLPLAHRLAETGGLIEPFSQRRVGTLGGLVSLQAIFNSILGANTAYTADVLVGGLLVSMLMLSGRIDLPRVALGALLACAFLLWDSGRNNLSPTYLTVALLGAAGVVAVSCPRPAAHDRRLLLILGVLGGGLLTLRVNHFLPLLMFGLLLVGSATSLGPRERVRAAAFFTAVSLGSVLPWMLALWRSSGTPLFPPFRGNLDSGWPGFRDPAIESLGDHATKLGDLFAAGEVRSLLAGALLAAGAGWWINRARRPMSRTPLLMIPGALVTLVVLAAALSAFLPVDLARLSWPLLAGVLVAGLVALADDVSRVEGGVAATASALVAAAVALWLAGPVEVGEQEDRHHGERRPQHRGARPGAAEAMEAALADYRSLQRSLPPGARIASASDFPQLFDLSRNDAVNLDIVGSVSPPPGFPSSAAQGRPIYALRTWTSSWPQIRHARRAFGAPARGRLTQREALLPVGALFPRLVRGPGGARGELTRRRAPHGALISYDLRAIAPRPAAR